MIMRGTATIRPFSLPIDEMDVNNSMVDHSDMLVDPGASSNFVRRDWALSHRLRMRELMNPLDVTLADGQFAGRLTGAVVVKSLQATGLISAMHAHGHGPVVSRTSSSVCHG